MWYILVLAFSVKALARCGLWRSGGEEYFQLFIQDPIWEDNDFGKTKRLLRFRLDCGQTCENVKKTYGNNFDHFLSYF
jgi:hypothetical protein